MHRMWLGPDYLVTVQVISLGNIFESRGTCAYQRLRNLVQFLLLSFLAFVIE